MKALLQSAVIYRAEFVLDKSTGAQVFKRLPNKAFMVEDLAHAQKMGEGVCLAYLRLYPPRER